MNENLIKEEYPFLEECDLNRISMFINGKCSQYYFIDYLRCSNANIDDAIEFYLLDDKLRTLLIQYLIRFEIQIKSDFAKMLSDSTNSSCFWSEKKFYIEEARHPGPKGKISSYTKIQKRIKENLKRISFSSMGPSNYVIMYTSSFGTFQELFKNIDVQYKKEFVDAYTSHLNIHTYKMLNTYLEAIRTIRNRCAHGNHIISIKMVNDLNNLRNTMFSNNSSPNTNYHLTVLEATIIFLIKQLKCGKEFKRKLKSLLSKHQILLKKYNGKHSLSGETIAKIN